MITYAPEVDRITIPQGLLRLFKQHMRVTFDTDDQIIVWKLQTAIDLIERLTQFHIFKRTAEWTPTLQASTVSPFYPFEAGTLGYPLPARPITAWTAADENDVDITADFTIMGGDPIDPASRAYLTTTTTATNPIVALTIGYAYPMDMPPSLVDVAMKIAAYLYEFREQQNVPGVDVVGYSNSLLSGFWMPRC